MPTLKVTVGERQRMDNLIRERIADAQDGEDLDDAQPRLNFESYADLSRLLSSTNLELLEAIHRHDPESISAVAELVGRDYKQVHQNISELEDIGVIELEGSGEGKAKKPTLAYDGLEIDIPFAPSDEGADAAPNSA